MQRPLVVSDALLEDLIAAGQADIVVGIATFNDAGTLEHVLDAVLEAFTTTLLRERTVLVAADGGSGDSTLELVRGTAPSDAARPFRHPLRTVHRIGRPYPGGPSARSGLRLLLAATELLGARSLILVDPADQRLRADEVTALARATLHEGLDLVSPVFPRAPSGGLLVTQLVRPLVRALCGRRLQEPLALPLACSGRLAVDLGRRSPWARLPDALAGELWLTTQALAGDWRAAQLPLPPRQPGGSHRGTLPEVFVGIVSTLLERAAGLPAALEAIAGSRELPVLGSAPGPIEESVQVDVAAAVASFRAAREQLQPLWAQILSPDVLASLLDHPDGPAVGEDPIWVRTVYQFLLARERAAMPPIQLARALFPLYEGRVAAFLRSLDGLGTAAAGERLEVLALEFERQRSSWRSAIGGPSR